MRSWFLPKANQKLQEFLPYHTNKDCSTFLVVFLVSVCSFFAYNPCLFGSAEILVILGLHFWEERWPHKFILNFTDLYYLIQILILGSSYPVRNKFDKKNKRSPLNKLSSLIILQKRKVMLKKIQNPWRKPKI